MEALGHRGARGSLSINDLELRERGLGRVGDIYIEQKGFEKLEQKIYAVLDDLPAVKKNQLSQVELLNELGKTVDDNESILNKASKHNIPIFSPGLLDSMLGLHLWTYSQLKKISIDPLRDLNELSNYIYNSTKSGAIILGGGLPKHHVLGANILRDGVDVAVQITLDRPEGGSQSGAPLEEAISWKKVQSKEGTVTVIGDAIIIFPIMVAATIERLKEEDKQNLLTSAL
jgi:deoxyhypusine synthase